MTEVSTPLIESQNSPSLNTARSILAQVRKDTKGIRGRVWAYVLLMALIVALPVQLCLFIFISVIQASPETLQSGIVSWSMTTLGSVLSVLTAPFLLGVAWVCLKHLRQPSVGAWTVFKHVLRCYGSLLWYEILLGLASGIVFGLVSFCASRPGLAWLGYVLSVVVSIAAFVCFVYLLYVVPLILEARISVIEAIKRSFCCVREKHQFWLLVRTVLLILLCVITIAAVIIFPTYISMTFIYLKVAFEFLTVALALCAMIWAFPYLAMMRITLYSRVFTPAGDIVPNKQQES